ncbi:hypothetical protein CERZMDRAFT_101306 [Cercospora zeae-maydis SCOH1-5]|uniref:Methyltransferase domain-containing protein n=1 Tax=Cercospora zeae-maydis SCOH1-5 TaxID=717836 RepID=A0A6A6F5X7_9PEZI|nr:hypothetical protein CERZMDRAFT_101306 [Cercospora zeae-maydis SCOH1-5]
MADKATAWSTSAQAYSTKVVHLTSRGGVALLTLLETTFPPPDPRTANILDAGAGTGAFTTLLSTTYPNTRIHAADFAPQMLSHLQSLSLPNITTQILDSSQDHTTQGLTPNTFTHAFSTFLIQFLPSPHFALHEMTRLLQPQTGLLGTAIWTKSHMHEPWDTACKNLDAGYIAPSASNPFGQTMKSIADLEAAYRNAGIVDVVSSETELWFECESAEEFADYFLDSKNPAFVTMQGGWKGDVEGVRKELARVTREMFGSGDGAAKVRIPMVAGCSVGRKA